MLGPVDNSPPEPHSHACAALSSVIGLCLPGPPATLEQFMSILQDLLQMAQG